MRIVIVDGEAQVREELIKLLEKSGPEYKVAAPRQMEEKDMS